MRPTLLSFYLRGIFIVSGVLLGSSCRSSHEQPIATVGNATITLSDFRSRLQDTPAAYQQYATTPEGRRQFLNILIREKLLLLEGRKSNLRNEENYRKSVSQYKKKWERELSDYEDSLLIEMYLAKLRSTALSVTDADIRKYYDDHAADFAHPVEIQASHILVATPDAASSILARLKAGESFENLARTMSMDPATAVHGGKLAPFTPGTLMPEFENAVVPMKVGQVSDIVKTPFGYHIIKKTGQRPLPSRSFDQAKDEIQNRLQRERFDQWITQAQTKLGVKIDEQALGAVSAVPGAPTSAGQPGAASSAREMESVR